MRSKNTETAKIPRFRGFVPIEPLEGRVLLSSSPQGLSPAQIRQAYNLNNIIFTVNGQSVSANGAGETIAIVDAFADPNIASDLRTFDAQFGISDNNALGQFVLSVATPEGAVATDSGWAVEESLDVEWAHAIAPEANILLVEGPDTVTGLASAAAWAASQTGVVAVSMSWGDSPEFRSERSYDSYFTTPGSHAGVTFLASSGDNGVPNYPSTSPNVLAVGGTTLTMNSSGTWISESPWNGSGGGVSPYEGTNKPDVAYDGNPSSGFSVYDSLPDHGQSGWLVLGGTSAGTPQWASIIALVDQGRSLRGLGSLDGVSQTIPDIYALPSSDFNPVSGGGLTGLGSPVGEKVISDLVGGGITSVGSPTGSAAKLVFAQQPTGTAAGGTISPAITVDVEDSSGNIVTGDTSTVTLSIGSQSGATIGSVLTGSITATAVNGVATFSNVSISGGGNYVLSAGDGHLTSASSNSITITGTTVAEYRLYNSVTREHLLTDSLNEYTTLGTEGWTQEGSPFKVYDGPTTVNGISGQPLYRLYDTASRQHLFTTDANEYNTLRQFSYWQAEGIAAYVFTTQVAGSVALYRLNYPSVTDLHLLTTNTNENSVLQSTYGWVSEGVIGYVITS